jgi:hypothetical protein
VFCFSALLLLHFVPFSKSLLTLLIFIPPSVLYDYIDSALTLCCVSAFFIIVIVQAGRKKEVIGFWTRPAIFLCKGDGAALLKFVTQNATSIFAERKNWKCILVRIASISEIQKKIKIETSVSCYGLNFLPFSFRCW